MRHLGRQHSNAILFALILVIGMTAFVCAEAGGDASGKTGARPGLNNPAMNPGRWTLFRDDELYVSTDFFGTNIVHQALASPTSPALNAWDVTDADETVAHRNNGWKPPRIAMAAGRVTDYAHDQVVRAYITDGTEPRVDLLDPSGKLLDSVRFPDPDDDANYSRVDMAVGDVLIERDTKGFYHDEVVVAHAYKQNGTYPVTVSLLDQNLDVICGATHTHTDVVGDIRLELGDFNGDGFLEMAVIIDYTNGDYSVTAYRYDAGTKKLVAGAQFNGHLLAGDGYGFDTAAGDFNGDGRDEIALCAYHMLFFSSDNNLNFVGSADRSIGDYYFDADGQLVSGLFHLDPANGYGIDRRQLAWLSNVGGRGVYVNVYRVGDSFDLAWQSGGAIGDDGKSTYANCNMTAGNFVGHLGGNTSPLMQFAVSYVETVPPERRGALATRMAKAVCMATASSDPQTLQTTWMRSGKAYSTDELDWESQLPAMYTNVLAYDRDGDTYRLGPPVHIVVDNVIGLDCLLQEPPKHADFLPEDPLNWTGAWSMLNISYYAQIHMAFEDESDQTVQTTATATTDRSIGGSVAVSAEGSTSVNAFLMKGAVTVAADAEVSYDYEQHKASWNSQYSSRSTSVTMETDDDDILYGKLQLIDIWRYPVYGAKTDDGLNVFQDIVLPGPVLKFNGGGLSCWDWYQPVHQNHNILSYPALGANFPGDVGPFSLPDGTVITDVMTDNTVYAYDGNAHNVELRWTQTAGSGSEKEWTNKIGDSADLSVSYTGEAGIGDIEDTESTWKVAVHFDSSNSWGGKTTEETTSSKTTGVQIDIPGIPLPSRGWAYPFLPAVYINTTGTLKAAHAIDFGNLTNMGPNWAKYYGSRPDPALNLPNRIQYVSPDEYTYGTCELVKDESRMTMRGFFIRKETPNPVSGKLDPLAEAPTDGDKVELAARVYNFSIGQATGAFTVRFDRALIDTSSATELAGTRVTIGNVSMASLKPLEMREAVIVLDTTGLSNTVNPATGKLDYNLGYRFYVVVDPGNAISNEIHEWKDPTRVNEAEWTDAEGRLYHGNNEGFWPVSGGVMVHPKGSGAHPPDPEPPACAVTILTPEGLVTGEELTIPAGHRYRLRAQITDVVQDTTHRQFLFMASLNGGDPKVVEMATVRGIRSTDTYVWANWKPLKPGAYRIWATYAGDLERPSSSNPENALHVTVGPSDIPTPGEGEGEGEGEDGGGGCNGQNGADPPIDGAAILAALAGFWLLFRWYGANNNKPGF